MKHKIIKDSEAISIDCRWMFVLPVSKVQNYNSNANHRNGMRCTHEIKISWELFIYASLFCLENLRIRRDEAWHEVKIVRLLVVLQCTVTRFLCSLNQNSLSSLCQTKWKKTAILKYVRMLFELSYADNR